MKPIKITDRNIMFTEPMGSVYSLNLGLILGNRYNFLIDTGLGSGSVAPILDFLEGNDKPIVVVNTHHHWDHVWGNWVFSNSLIIAHTLCRELEDKYWDLMIEENSSSIDGKVERCLPNLLIKDYISYPDEDIEIFFTPGHSADGISVYDRRDKVLYAGDNIGDTDDVIVPYIDTDIEVFRKTIEEYTKYDFEICISGHNHPKGKNITELMKADLEKCWANQANL